MIPYTTYKIIHYLGIFVLLTSMATRLGRAAVSPDAVATGGRSEVSDGASAAEASRTRPPRDPWARRLGVLHGLALFLVLLGGFGMLARLDVTHELGLLPGWVWAKLVIWTLLGSAVLAARWSTSWSARLLVAAPALAVLAGIIALTKPF